MTLALKILAVWALGTRAAVMLFFLCALFINAVKPTPRPKL